tara:strand:+ start:232 stop:465 length:234 start_codon:yes stop_codon:yes gene_type:complete
MKQHFCPIEQSVLAYQGQCNWCGEKELARAKPRTWVGLTEDDAIELLPVMSHNYKVDIEMILEFAKAIEEKLKELNR